MSEDKVHLGVDVEDFKKHYLRVAAFMVDVSVSEYVRRLIDNDMEGHPDWVSMARERSHTDA